VGSGGLQHGRLVAVVLSVVVAADHPFAMPSGFPKSKLGCFEWNLFSFQISEVVE